MNDVLNISDSLRSIPTLYLFYLLSCAFLLYISHAKYEVKMVILVKMEQKCKIGLF